MDYSQTYYFPGTQGPHHPVPVSIPLLTTSHSNSAGSKDLSTISPSDAFYHHTEQFQNFDSCADQCDPTPDCSGPPIATSRYRVGHNGQWNIHRSRDFAAAAVHQPLQADGLRLSIKPEPTGDPDANLKVSNSTHKDDLALAQSRRRAQNRAAQRAFRKRKAQHVKDFEAKLASLAAAQREIASENERLKRDLQEMHLENAMLKATTSINGGHLPGHDDAPVTTLPLQYNSLSLQDGVAGLLRDRYVQYRCGVGPAASPSKRACCPKHRG
ncbi:hypothetical protein F5883DRAFT_720689 [Diaporthe sp. PMI_573]|nr:hypothetical protein F5883DRAFT_720689 [Diaporthaceae sp. PMI_573]